MAVQAALSLDLMPKSLTKRGAKSALMRSGRFLYAAIALHPSTGTNTKTQQTMLGEWLNTGDKFRCDADGYFWFSGRADDMLKVGGIWVSPIEVENALAEHDAVLETAVVVPWIAMSWSAESVRPSPAGLYSLPSTRH